jgi:hypothetical protein
VQGRVRYKGKVGLFDDVAGPGWQLLHRGASAEAFTGAAQEVIDRLGIIVATFGADGDTADLDGTYEGWFDGLNADAILVRPDFYVFGTSASGRDRSDLVTEVWTSLQGGA